MTVTIGDVSLSAAVLMAAGVLVLAAESRRSWCAFSYLPIGVSDPG